MKGIIYPAFLRYCPGADTPAQKIFRLSRGDKRNVTASTSLCRVIYQKDSWDYIAMPPSSKIKKRYLKNSFKKLCLFFKIQPSLSMPLPQLMKLFSSGWNSLRSTVIPTHTSRRLQEYSELCCSRIALTKARIEDYCPTTTLGWSSGETRVCSLGIKETPVLTWGDIWAILGATEQINAEDKHWRRKVSHWL